LGRCNGKIWIYKWIGINEIADLNDKDKVILDFSPRKLKIWKNICQSTVAFNLLLKKFHIIAGIVICMKKF